MDTGSEGTSDGQKAPEEVGEDEIGQNSVNVLHMQSRDAWDLSVVDGGSQACRRNTPGPLKNTSFGRRPAGWMSLREAESPWYPQGR